jgi:hypothetical protein
LSRIACERGKHSDALRSNETLSQVIGITSALERFLIEAEERGNTFLLGLLEKQHVRLKALFNNHIVSAAFLHITRENSRLSRTSKLRSLRRQRFLARSVVEQLRSSSFSRAISLAWRASSPALVGSRYVRVWMPVTTRSSLGCSICCVRWPSWTDRRARTRAR